MTALIRMRVIVPCAATAANPSDTRQEHSAMVAFILKTRRKWCFGPLPPFINYWIHCKNPLTRKIRVSYVLRIEGAKSSVNTCIGVFILVHTHNSDRFIFSRVDRAIISSSLSRFHSVR